MMGVGNPELDMIKTKKYQFYFHSAGILSKERTLALLLQLVLKMIKIFNGFLTNLNAGTGKACAGQAKLMLSPKLLNKLEVFDSCENFGLAPPIGSTNHTFLKY